MAARGFRVRVPLDDGRELEALFHRLVAGILAHPVVRALMQAFVFVLCAFLAWKATDNQLSQTYFGLDPHDSIRRFLAGTQARPFAYRVFTPALIRLAQDVLHVPALWRQAPGFLAHKVPVICARYGAGLESSCNNILSYFFVGWWLYLGFLLTMFAMARRLFSGSIILGAANVYLAFALVNAIILRTLSHTYDWGTLLFGALFLWCLLAERPVLFCLLMPIACFNKETAVLFTLPFLLVNLPRLPPARTLLFFALQIASFVVVYGGERLYFAGNPGTWLEVHLMGQIYLFSEHITLALLFGLLGVVVLAFYRFPDKHPVLRASCIMILPWAVLFLIGAVPREIRDTFEILPLLVLMTMQSLVAFVSGRTPPATEPQR
jgi:hypothetical protein